MACEENHLIGVPCAAISDSRVAQNSNFATSEIDGPQFAFGEETNAVAAGVPERRSRAVGTSELLSAGGAEITNPETFSAVRIYNHKGQTAAVR